MKLFHQLEESDQHNAIHYCMHTVVEDMLDDGVQIEAFSEEDKKMRAILEDALSEALEAPEDRRFELLTSHKGAGQYIFDIALDMARASWYHSDEDMVINYESLQFHDEENESDDVTDDMIESVEDIVDNKPIDKSKLN